MNKLSQFRHIFHFSEARIWLPWRPDPLPDWAAMRIPQDDALVAFADLDRHYQISIHSTDIKSCNGDRIAFPEHELALFEQANWRQPYQGGPCVGDHEGLDHCAFGGSAWQIDDLCDLPVDDLWGRRSERRGYAPWRLQSTAATVMIAIPVISAMVAPSTVVAGCR
jgi:hypothetical protein